MINVVFLLLVFFLITARIAPPLPVEVTAPSARGEAFDQGPRTLVLDAEGRVHFGDATGAAALARLAAQAPDAPVILRADRGADAARLAAVLRDIGTNGGAAIRLVVAED